VPAERINCFLLSFRILSVWSTKTYQVMETASFSSQGSNWLVKCLSSHTLLIPSFILSPQFPFNITCMCTWSGLKSEG
jgi:hypothetical protein